MVCARTWVGILFWEPICSWDSDPSCFIAEQFIISHASWVLRNKIISMRFSDQISWWLFFVFFFIYSGWHACVCIVFTNPWIFVYGVDRLGSPYRILFRVKYLCSVLPRTGVLICLINCWTFWERYCIRVFKGSWRIWLVLKIYVNLHRLGLGYFIG